MTDEWQFPTAWAAVACLLRELGNTAVFGLPSDDLALLDAMGAGQPRLVLCRDQRNAVFMASGYALATGRIGVCVVGKGPAVANAVTGLVEASTGGVPVLVIAAGTAVARVGAGAFQELDQIRLIRPLVKWAARVEHPTRLVPVLRKALRVARLGAPGPVYVELPEDVASSSIRMDGPWRIDGMQYPAPDPEALRASCDLIARSHRPILLIGGGARRRCPPGTLEKLADTLGCAVFTTASGRGIFDERHPLYCGLSGLYAQPPAAALWQHTDLVIAVGSRLEETATFGWDTLPVGTPVLQVNLSEVAAVAERDGAWLYGDVGHTVNGWLRCGWPVGGTGQWRKQVADVRAALAGLVRLRLAGVRPDDPPRVAAVLAVLDELLPVDRILVQENGLQDMWSYFYPFWTATVGGSIVPSEQTSLGFGMAAAVGAALGAPDQAVVAFGGDGAFNLFRSDLVTVAAEAVPLLMVVLDNGGYGWLQKQLDQRLTPTPYRFTDGHRTTGAAVRDLGIAYQRVERHADVAPALRSAWSRRLAGQPAVVEVAVRLDDVPPGLEKLAGDLPAPVDG
jgi:acetolactate synthase I/II/III large subunit